MTEGRLRLTLLGGFLGAGKTTWLRHQLRDRAFGRVHVIVNEAAEAPVDDALLGAADRVTLLSGACVCCEGQGALRRTLLDLCNTRSGEARASERIETVVLETSGLADPAAILGVIRADPVLVRQIVVTETIVVVDAVNALAQIRSEALSRRQIEAADRLILTKIDRAAPEPVALLRAALAHMAPAAVQSAAACGSALPLPPMPDEPLAEPALLAPASDGPELPILATTLDLGPAPDWTAFAVWLSALLFARGDQIVRVKGVIRTPAGRLLLQAVRDAVQSPEILPDPGAPCATDNTIALIGRGISGDRLAASLRRFAA